MPTACCPHSLFSVPLHCSAFVIEPSVVLAKVEHRTIKPDLCPLLTACCIKATKCWIALRYNIYAFPTSFSTKSDEIK